MIDRFLPHDRREFVHKRLIRGATSFVTSGFNPLAAAAGFAAPLPRRAVSTALIRSLPIQLPVRTAVQKITARSIKFNSTPALRKASRLAVKKRAHGVLHKAQKIALRLGLPDPGHGAHRAVPTSLVASAPCLPPFRRTSDGSCKIFFGEQPGRDDQPIGDTVMGRYGAGEQPGSQIIDRAVCRPGMVLGDDGICYNRSQLKNSEREWPRGRRPLLTGGDMRAISTAARAGKRLEGATKRLQKIGLMKKPAPRPRKITSGSTEHHHHT